MIPKFRTFIKIKNAINPVQPVGAINFESETITIEQGLTFPFDKAILMQYTGLKDKNGVEIYEGDIIGIDVYYVDDFGKTYKERNYAEVFREQSGYWDCDFKDDLDSESLIVYVTEGEGIDHPWSLTVEGNIYENPELLKEQNK